MLEDLSLIRVFSSGDLFITFEKAVLPRITSKALGVVNCHHSLPL